MYLVFDTDKYTDDEIVTLINNETIHSEVLMCNEDKTNCTDTLIKRFYIFYIILISARILVPMTTTKVTYVGIKIFYFRCGKTLIVRRSVLSLPTSKSSQFGTLK